MLDLVTMEGFEEIMEEFIRGMEPVFFTLFVLGILSILGGFLILLISNHRVRTSSFKTSHFKRMDNTNMLVNKENIQKIKVESVDENKITRK